MHEEEGAPALPLSERDLRQLHERLRTVRQVQQ
jgi:hypothetical protein